MSINGNKTLLIHLSMSVSSVYQDFTTRQSGHSFVLFSKCLRKRFLTKNSLFVLFSICHGNKFLTKNSFVPPSKLTSGLHLVGQNSDGNVTGAACRCLDKSAGKFCSNPTVRFVLHYHAHTHMQIYRDTQTY